MEFENLSLKEKVDSLQKKIKNYEDKEIEKRRSNSVNEYEYEMKYKNLLFEFEKATFGAEEMKKEIARWKEKYLQAEMGNKLFQDSVQDSNNQILSLKRQIEICKR